MLGRVLVRCLVATRRRRRSSRLAFAACTWLALSPLAAAQPAIEDVASARHRYGPVSVTPRFSVTDVGVDTNVFNAVQNADADFVATFRPASDLWFQSGRWQATARTQVGANFFSRFASERSADTDNRVWAAGRAGRVTLSTTAMFLSTRDRISPEIDARVRHLERAVGAGIDVRVGARTHLRTTVDHLTTHYSDNAAVRSYAEALNRTNNSVMAAMRYRVTPLTTVVFEGSQQQSRFVYVNARDADSVSLMSGLEFARGALLSGRGVMGYRRIDFRSRTMPDFSGIAAAIDVGYMFQTATKFALKADRDVEYSFEFQEPYYVSTGLALNVVNQATDRWSVMGSLSRRRLGYRAAQAAISITPRTDHLTITRLGVGYRIAPRIRAELTAGYQRRSSQRLDRRYSGARVGFATFFEF